MAVDLERDVAIGDACAGRFPRARSRHALALRRCLAVEGQATTAAFAAGARHRHRRQRHAGAAA